MEFSLLDLDHSIHDIVELTGYASLGFGHDEFTLIRKVGKRDYPRFALFVKIVNGGYRGHHFVLHIENSSRSHDTRDKSPLIEKEVVRIKSVLMKTPEQDN